MRKMIETAAIGLSLCLAGLAIVTDAHAQDPEEGAVDLNETSKPATEPHGAPAWEAPPSASGFDADARGASAAEEPKVKEPGPGKFRVSVGGRIAVGGGFRPKGFDTGTYTASVSPGGRAGLDYMLIKYFSIGLETRLSWVQQKSSEHSFLIWDLVLKPRAVYRVKPVPLEIYLALPGGLSVNKPGDQKVTTQDGRLVSEEGKVGATIGLGGGATYILNDRWLFTAEMGWNWTFLRFDTWVTQAGPPGVPTLQVPTTAKVTLGQLAFTLNAGYAF